jgi:hypothetical protein
LRKELKKYRFDGCKRCEVMEKEKNCRRSLGVEMELEKRRWREFGLVLSFELEYSVLQRR